MDEHREHKRIFRSVLLINLAVFIFELIAASYSGSLSMLSDSFHMLIHVMIPGLAFISDVEFSGWNQAKVRKWTALASVFLFFPLAVFIFFEARERLLNPPELIINTWFFIIAFTGLAANLYTAQLTHPLKHHKECGNNAKAVFVHMIFDAVGSVIVIAGAVVIYYTGMFKIDPYLSFVLSGLLLLTGVTMSYQILKGHKHSH